MLGAAGQSVEKGLETKLRDLSTGREGSTPNRMTNGPSVPGKWGHVIILAPEETEGVVRGGRKAGESEEVWRRAGVGTIATGRPRHAGPWFGGAALTMAWMTAASGNGVERLIAVG